MPKEFNEMDDINITDRYLEQIGSVFESAFPYVAKYLGTGMMFSQLISIAHQQPEKYGLGDFMVCTGIGAFMYYCGDVILRRKAKEEMLREVEQINKGIEERLE